MEENKGACGREGGKEERTVREMRPCRVEVTNSCWLLLYMLHLEQKCKLHSAPQGRTRLKKDMLHSSAASVVSTRSSRGKYLCHCLRQQKGCRVVLLSSHVQLLR